MKWVGAVLLLAGCSVFGFSVGKEYQKDTKLLRGICQVITSMICEVQYLQTPLPHLCRSIAATISHPLSSVLTQLSSQIEKQIAPDVSTCMQRVLSKRKDIPPCSASCLQELANHLGRYDLAGQIQELEKVHCLCEQKLGQLEANAQMRIRSYQIFGLCAGAALAILLI